MKTDQLIQKILSDSAALNELHQAVNASAQVRHQSPAAKVRWQIACEAWHSAPDTLFFPGGCANILRAIHGDPVAISEAVHFLHADPTHFRSGYLKEQFWHHAPRWPLSPTEQQLIASAALNYLSQRPRRDFWSMCRAMSYIAQPEFWSEVQTLLTHADAHLAKRANYLYAYRNGAHAGATAMKALRQQWMIEAWQNRKKR